MDSKPQVPLSVDYDSTDLAVFSAIQQRQMRALDILYERYGRLIYSVAFRILNSVEEAEDVTQEIFLKLWQQCDRYQPHRGSLSNFLVVMARSRAIDKVRSRQSARQRLQKWQGALTMACAQNHPLEAATIKERKQLVRTALSQLSDAERQVLETAYYGGLSQSEIAKQSNLPLGTVKSRSRQALRKLRLALQHKL